MSDNFKVKEKRYPNQVIIQFGAMDKCLFARMLSAYGFGVREAGDTFEHIKKMVYND